MTAPKIHLYSDGSAHERSGLPGGWAYVIVRGDEVIGGESGAEKKTTNNVMELTAALRALEAVVRLGLHQGAEVELITDSRVVLEVSHGAKQKHAALGEALQVAAAQAHVTVKWVRAHSGNRWNEHVDELAHQAKMRLVPMRVRRRKGFSTE